ncbi:MAG TPA: precorrin-3B C(17)-methyltransferase, partial [Actinomycetota bacterium]
KAGHALAAHLAAAWPAARLYDGRPREALAAAWKDCRGVVAFMATGAAVRLTTPLLADKWTDPGLVCVDDAGRFAVAVLGGHEGGANALAAAVAEVFEWTRCTPVVTTASDAAGWPALGVLGADLGFRLDPSSDVARVAGAMLAGDPVALVSDLRWPLPPLPPNVVPSEHPRPPCIVVSDHRLGAAAGSGPLVLYRPPSLVVGVGCSRGATAEEILDLVDATLADAGLCGECVAALATVDAKRDEPGLVEAAARRGWPLRCFPAAELASVAVPNPSEAARRAVGTSSVAEAGALAGAGACSGSAGSELVVPKRRSARVTAAVARIRPRGRLHLVGAGPGDPGLVPPMARDALARSEHVIGLARYVDVVRPFLRPGTKVEPSELGNEEGRAARAVRLAEEGASVALVSSGDAGVYGMASPALAVAGPEIDVAGVPGVTAAHAAAALLGAPLGHDHCAISLSDLLTPWPVIRRRLAAAAAADFAVALYNPRSSGRDWQLPEARRILLQHRSPGTPVGVVTDAFRPGQTVELTTLGDLDPARVGMTTTVVVGSSSTVVAGGRMVTPRGYGGLRAHARPGTVGSCRPVHPIEEESYRILRGAVDLSNLPALSRAVAERIVHATADLAIAGTLVLDEAALEAGVEALRGGCPVVADSRMVRAGITSRPVVCALDLDAAGPEGPDGPDGPDGEAITRSARAVRRAAEIVGAGAVWAVGCAPTALFEVLASAPEPALVVGLPVGFVGAAESKEALASSGLPALTNRGPKGGSAAAAAAVNALLHRCPAGESP